MALNKLFADSSKQLDIYARKGVILNENILAVDSNVDSFDLSSYTATLTVYDPEDKTTAIITPTITMNDGSIDIDASAAVMDIASNNYYYELVVSLPSSAGDEVWLTGNFIVNDGIFESGTSASSITINTGVASTSVTLTVNSSSATISSLLDTNITGIADNEILTWDSTTSKWINEAPAVATVTLDEAYTGGNTITVDTNLTPVTIQGGTATDTDNNLVSKNNAGTTTFSVDGNGKVGLATGLNNGINFANTSISENGNNLRFTLSGVVRFSGASYFDFNNSARMRILNEDSTAINPIFVTRGLSPDTGIGGITGEISLINGGVETINLDASNNVTIGNGSLEVSGAFGVNGATPLAKPTITGSTGGNAALQNLLTQLANYGLITDSTT